MLHNLQLESPRRPYADITAFRDAMAAMAATVCVVATQLGAERIGRTVTSVLSLTADPPAVVVSIDAASQLADHIGRTGGFSLAVLAHDQQAIADAFAGAVEPAQRFAIGQWLSWKSGHPRLIGAVAAMECEVLGAVATPTHILFIGGAVAIDLAGHRSPLIWQQREYKSLAEIPPPARQAPTGPAPTLQPERAR
jgi:flavin reductase (DIM6/NTAB) family NADH-FMN oxidoreductase RutF